MATDSKARILREGERYVQQGKINQAISEYLKIVKIDPEDVLTLNTIGDLYLRQGRVSEANRLFLQVAESYVRNNFLLKGIAVYKKILNTDPHNLQVNLQVASLYARQGMNVDARSQYLYVADLYAREGRTSESLDAYEKVVEIDPMNAPILLKLAETYLTQGLQDKAHICFSGAARAQMKAGDIGASMSAFRNALAIDLGSSDALKGFLETALQTDDLRGALNLVKESITKAQDDPELHELLGRSYLAANDAERAEQYFLAALREDDSRYGCFLQLSKSLLQADNPDRALACLQPILSTLICRRETERLVDAYHLILAKYPSHIATLTKLSEILSATNDEQRNLEVLERIVDHHLSEGNPSEALEAMESILAIAPESEPHLNRHREVFELAFPGRAYRVPRAVAEAAERNAQRNMQGSDSSAGLPASEDDGSSSTIVEIDLLLNYGMKEKALQLLRTLEAATPLDKEVRRRLITMYRESGEHRLAAEQHLLLSAIYRKAGDLETAEKSWAEARKLAPDWVSGDLDVAAFAQKCGIFMEPAKADAPFKEPAGSQEVDLSGDLSEIFFKDTQEEADVAPGMSGIPEEATEFPQDLPRPPAPESIAEQLQEVDFYIRLGFHDEARAKLEEIAITNPDHAELASRFEQLGLQPSSDEDAVVIALPEGGGQIPDLPDAAAHSVTGGAPVPAAFEDIKSSVTEDDRIANDLEMAASHFGANNWFEMTEEPDQSPAGSKMDLSRPPKADSARIEEAPTNAMFADLMNEVNALTDQGITREDFETHFSLGIAFREMGLTEDAIKEFQQALKALDPDKFPREVIQSCGMLSTCFLEKGMPRSAIRWCQTGLGVREISPHEAIALRYDMAEAHSSAGDFRRALECFSEIFGIDPSYRDVAQRIDNLKSDQQRHAP